MKNGMTFDFLEDQLKQNDPFLPPTATELTQIEHNILAAVDRLPSKHPIGIPWPVMAPPHLIQGIATFLSVLFLLLGYTVGENLYTAQTIVADDQQEEHVLAQNNMNFLQDFITHDSSTGDLNDAD